MQTKLILNLTGLGNTAERKLATVLLLSSLMRVGFTWADGTNRPRNTDADAVILNHPDAESPNIVSVIPNGTLSEDRLARFKDEAQTTVFDGAKLRELDLFLVGAEYIIKSHRHASGLADDPREGWSDRTNAHLDSIVDDHLARPMGWSNRGTNDPIYTFEMEGVRVSVCKHVALMTIPKEKGKPSDATTSRLEAEALKVRKEKFGF